MTLDDLRKSADAAKQRSKEREANKSKSSAPQAVSGNAKVTTAKQKLADLRKADGLMKSATDHIQPSPIYDYTGASRKNTSTQAASKQEIEYDSGSVLRLGAGPISNNAVSQKVVSGELKITGTSKDGKYTVAKNKSYVAPKKAADIIDVSEARKAELEAIKNPTKSQREELAHIMEARADRQKEINRKAAEAQQREALEMGDNPFSWLSKSRDSSLPLSTLDRQAQNNVIGNSAAAGAETIAGSLMSMIATLNELDARTRARDEADSAKLRSEQGALERGEDISLKKSNEAWQENLKAGTERYTIKDDLVHELSNTLMSNAEELRREAYEAAGDEGKFLVDLLYTGTQMAGDLVSNLILPGSGLWLMSARVFGQSAYEARANGADASTQLVTGLKSAVIEHLTEKLGGGALKKIYGAGIADNAIERMLGSLLKTDKGRTVTRFLLECTGEGLEEVISDIANPIADRLLGLDDGEGEIITDEDIGQMWYDFMLGTALGGMGSAVNIYTGSYENQNARLRNVEAAQRALIESGLESAEGTESRRLAEQYKKTIEAGRVLSKRQVQKLTKANDTAIAEEGAKAIAQEDVTLEAMNSVETREFLSKRYNEASEAEINAMVRDFEEGIPLEKIVTEADARAKSSTYRQEHTEKGEIVPESNKTAQDDLQITTAADKPIAESADIDTEGPMELWDADSIGKSMFPKEFESGILDEKDAADIQTMYDASGRTMDLNELKAMVQVHIEQKLRDKSKNDNENKEVNDNGRGNDLDGSMGRQSSKSAGEQGEAVRSSAEGDKGAQSGGEHRADAGGEGVRGTSGKKPKPEKVSGKSLKIPKGTDNKTLTVVKPSGVNERIVKTFSKASNGITLVNGKIEQQIGDEVISVTGMCTADGRVFACMNHPIYSGTKLLLHECGHLYIDSDTEMRRDMHAAALKIIKGSALEELANRYAQLWKGLYKMPEGIKTDEELADYFDNNPDAYADFLETYEKEIWCDALAGLDRARAGGAAKLTDEIRRIFKEYTGIDVEALLVGKEATETEIEETDGKNEPERPRNNSPPSSESYSINNTRYLPIKEQLKEFRAGKMSSHDEFYFGIAPKILNADGLAERPLVMSQTDLRKASSEKHTVPTRAITRLSEILSDPILSFSAGTRIGILTKDIDGDGKPLLVAIARDVDLDNETVNRIKSAYGLDNPQAWLKNQIENKKALRIYDEKEADHFLDEFGYKAERPENFRSGDIVTASPKEVNSQNYSDSYSIDENLEYDLYTVYNDDFDSSRNEVHIGTASNFITQVIGAKGFDLYMPANKAYQAMATEERAIFDGKPTGGNINYHGLGVKGLMNILKKSETPIAAYAAAPDEKGKRENRIVLVTDEEIDGGLGVVIEELETKARHEGVRIKANKAITAYSKANIENAVADAMADGRILYIDEKRSRMLRSGGKGSNYPTAISEGGFTDNIRRFWENVKWKISGKESFTVEPPQDTEPEWKAKLRQFSEDSYSADDELLVEGEAGYANALRTARERARRLSIAKLEAEINKFSGKISGYEQTEDRTERMELELQDLKNRCKVYSEILEVKKKKREEQDEIRHKASKDAWKTARSFVDENGRNISKHALTEQLFKDFSINKYADNVSETRDIINAFADEYAKAGKITRKSINQLFNCLMSTGEYIKIDHFAAEIRSELNGGFINVPSEVKNEFGSDWDGFYRRAFENGIYLRVDSGSRRIFEWTESLAKSFGKNEFNPDADLKTQLERIVELAEEGKAQNMNLFQMAEYVRNQNGQEAAEAILDDLYQKLEDALKAYAVSAKLEMNVKQKTAYRKAKDRAIRQENARRAQEARGLRELQKKTLKQLQELRKIRDKTSKEWREQIDKLLEGIDTVAISAANAMNYSKKYEATWGSLADMYKEARANDPNFLKDEHLEKILDRVEGKHLADMDASDIGNLYRAAYELRTKINNAKNIVGSKTHMLFSEAYDAVAKEMHEADKPKNKYSKTRDAMREVMNPNHFLESLVGWNRESVWFKTIVKGLEDGERNMKRYIETSKQMLDEFAKTNKKWLEAADGQGKDGIWYEVELSPVVEMHMGEQTIFGKPVKVYMTPLQKVHMYLESKNDDNLTHMLGGRIFADKELYSKGKKDEAFNSEPVHLAPQDVRRICSDLTKEEMELANILEKYYNVYAKDEINKVSNPLYGYDRAMGSFYAPICTKQTYSKSSAAIMDGSVEGVGYMKERIHGAKTPTLNLSALEVFNRHVSQTSRFVGMAIPLHNAETLLNWRQNGKPMQEVIAQEWSTKDLEYIQKLLKELHSPSTTDSSFIDESVSKLQSNYIGATFGFNPSVAFKVFGSFGLASAELGFDNVKGTFAKVNPELIRKYTSEYDVRVRGYASPEVAQLINSQGKIEKAIQGNKVTKELFGGGLMIHTDAIVARAIWAWSESAVRSENPELKIGTQEEINAGQSPFYRAVADRFNTAIGDTQSMYDVMHRSALLKSDSDVTRAFTMFHTDIMQALNLLIKAKGEAAYYTNAAKENPNNEFYKEKAKRYEHSFRRAATAAVTSSLLVALVSTLNALLKRREDFYDENNKFMWSKLGADYIVYVLKDFAGMIPFGFEQAVGIGLDSLKGEKWYDIELMGLGAINDILNTSFKIIEKLQDGKLRPSDLKDLAFLAAKMFGGLPLDNVESYTLGLFSWVAPEIGEAYNNMISPPKKSDLKGKTGEVLERDIYDMYKGFGLDRETTDEIARLYELGFDKIIYGTAPDSITNNGTEYELDKDAKESFESTKQETLSKLAEVIASNEYQIADDKERAGMLKRLNAYANETAKAAAVSEYDMPSWVESCKSLVDAGESIMSVASMPYTESANSTSSNEGNDPRYVKLIKAGVEYNNAREIEETLTMLLPEGNAKSVTQVQKVAAVAYMPIPENEKSAAIELIYGTTGKKNFEKYQTAVNLGLSSAAYADFLSALDRINDNSGVSQDEFKQAVIESGMPDYVAEALWKTYGWKKAYSRN